jgi:hypothetical protein
MLRTLRRASVASSALLLRFSLTHRAHQHSSTPLGWRGGRTHGAIQKFCFDIPRWDIEAEASPKINPKIRGLNFTVWA